MGAAAYNRGTKRIAAEAYDLMVAANARADRQALRDENDRLRAQVAALEKTLARARRCLAAERYSGAKRIAELKADIAVSTSAVAMLCRIAFPQERS